MNYFDMVAQFNSRFAIPRSRMNKERLSKFRAGFMQEELDEYREAVEKGDPVGQVDALCDLIYVAIGAAIESGFVGFDSHFAAVHAANMAKVPGKKPGREHSEGFDAIKPEGWTGPEADHAAIFALNPPHAATMSQN